MEEAKVLMSWLQGSYTITQRESVDCSGNVAVRVFKGLSGGLKQAETHKEGLDMTGDCLKAYAYPPLLCVLCAIRKLHTTNVRPSTISLP